ncbi:prepilin-type N-terminal cleavage/methylation domain-containing protein [candidate division GN15 bacterium]|nr:prepilin-type N-terminal cleavage/methylation domain-containing protein [candidate division GN15 bacterium]
MPNYSIDNRGFTLIELMVVVVIVGILSALAIPRFMGSSVKAKQGEAQIILKQIVTLQMTYRVDSPTATYFESAATASADNPLAFEELGLEIPPTALYSFTCEQSDSGFTATAVANLDDDDFEDQWQIHPSGVLYHTQNDITNTSL